MTETEKTQQALRYHQRMDKYIAEGLTKERASEQAFHDVLYGDLRVK